MGSLRNGQFVYVNEDYECPPPKRARPNFFKCDQCRKSRIKCEPENRIWPQEKCHNCIRRNLSCSPNTRQRKTPPQPDLTPAEQTGNVGAIASFPDFLHAVQNGITPIVKRLLNHSQSADWCSQSIDEDDRKPIHEAAAKGHSEIVRLLIKHGVSPDEKDKSGRTPLWEAAFNGHFKTTELLIQCKASLDMADYNEGEQAIHQASFKGFPDIVRLLVQSGADVDTKTRWGETPLSCSVKGDSLDVVKYLVDLYHDMKPLSTREHLLHYAVECGNIEIVDVFLNSGADIDSKDDEGQTPLSSAAQGGHAELVAHLISRGASLTYGDDNYLLYNAVCGGILDLVRALLKDPEHLEGLNDPDLNPLTVASEKGHVEIMQLLFDAGADVNIERDDDEVPIVEAAGSGMIPAIRLLIQLGADVNAQDIDGKTALFQASKHGNIEAVTLLIQANAEINLEDKNRQNALYVASANGHTAVVEALIKAGAEVKTDAYCSLLAASYLGRHDIVEILLRNRADPNSSFEVFRPSPRPYDDDKTPIFYAVQNGWSDTVIQLHALGADLDKRRSSAPYTPLYVAAAQGDLQMIGLLLACGANPDLCDSPFATSPESPLGIAIIKNKPAIAYLLLNHGALSKQQKVSCLWGALCAAERCGFLDLVKFLLTYTDIVNIEDSLGESLLHKAVSDSSLRLVDALLDSGAEVNKKNRSGYTPLIMATFIRKPIDRLDICKTLIDAGGDVNGSDYHEVTILMRAVSYCDISLVRFLLHRGADRKAKDLTGRTALERAEGNSVLISALAGDSTESISISGE